MVTLETRPTRSTKFLAILALLVCGLLISSCESKERKRPYGLVNLGKIADLKRPLSFLSSHSLLLRFDEKGFSAMSLLCSYDLAPLKVREQGQQQILVSPYSKSTYSLDGLVLTGPTENPLPYYELVASAGVYNGPIDTLFAKIGANKPASWRLMPP